MARPTANFVCTECGWTTLKWAGRCGECQQWGTVIEKDAPTRHTAPARVAEGRAARPITDIAPRDESHTPTGIVEFDRVLGGGIVPGAAILLSGEPGVGKSTLLLEVAARAAKRGQRVLYVSAEESVAQVRLRAGRTGALNSELFLAAETDLATILGQLDEVRPELLIVDSVQTVFSEKPQSASGSIGRIREAATQLLFGAKSHNIPTFLVGHVTKDGALAGPKVL
ncbi:MAG: DNA repair protein RadA, partial [Leifsonia sp.]|nr:DNA repair protein RadA [Leifsonia sp.]